MIDDLTINEQEAADRKASEYLEKGYRVARQVPLECLPGYSAGLVVEKDGMFKVIEVKSRSSLGDLQAVRELERVINGRQGWSFELNIVGEPEKLTVPEGSSWLDESAIRMRLDQADRLVNEGLAEAALLIAWSGAEAATRMLAADEGVTVDRATDSGYILGIAVAHGAISREDYRSLRLILSDRNAIAHGLMISGSISEAVSDLIGIVNRLLQERRGLPEPSHARA